MNLVRNALSAWSAEPRIYGEERWTGWGAGWHAWTGPAAEVEFCEFVGAVAALVRPKVAVETGVGAGYTTRRLVPHVGEWVGYESHPDFRKGLEGLAPPGLQPGATPSRDVMAKADLIVIDSDPKFRLAEFDLWLSDGKPGSVLISHDVSNRHRPDQPHTLIYDHIIGSGAPGILLTNPRGGWIGQHG